MTALFKKFEITSAILDLSACNVTDDISVKNAIQSITTEANRIDVLVNNAGYGLAGAFEDLSMEEIKAQCETNSSASDCTRAQLRARTFRNCPLVLSTEFH